jgi:hypothetical protein
LYAIARHADKKKPGQRAKGRAGKTNTCEVEGSPRPGFFEL